MKRFFRSMLVVVAAMTAVMTMSSFTQQDDELDVKAILKAAVEEVNDSCPMDMGDGMILRETYIANNRMVYDFQATAEVVDGFKAMLDLDAPATNKLMAEAMLGGSKEVVFLFACCVDVEYGIEFRFSVPNSSQSVNMLLSAEELATVLDEKYSEEELKEIIVDLMLQYLE